MPARSASYSVADPDLKVKGVRGLRIVDASIMVSASDLGSLVVWQVLTSTTFSQSLPPVTPRRQCTLLQNAEPT